MESVSPSVDMGTRRTAPFPDVTALLDAQLRVDQALDWAAPRDRHGPAMSARPPLPSYEQVLQLPREVDGFVVPPAFEDENGHMNIRHYLDLAAGAIAQVFSRVGITDDYRGSRARLLHRRAPPALPLRDPRRRQCVRPCAHPRGVEKVVHAMAFLVNDTARQFAYTLEVIALHVDLSPPAAPHRMPDDIARAWDNEIKATADVAWEAPVCGAMGIRR